MKLLGYLSIVCLAFSLFACSGKAVVKAPEDFDAERYFTKANKMIEEKNYKAAREVLLEVKNRDLSKKVSPLAQLRIADSYVLEGEPELAVAEYRKFLEMYPDHRHAAYAQYQIAMTYFNEIESPERGYGGAEKALTEFEKLKKDFPRNPYRDVIDLRIEKCRSTMADYQLLVGEYYMRKESYTAAIGRFEGLLKKFPDYKKTENVLLNLGIAYKKSGKKEKSEEYFKQLFEKYPNSPLAKDAKKELSSLKAEKK